MAWSLEIHHLDVQSVGDATLIIAREPTLVPPVVRTVLIDGGKTEGGPIIHAKLLLLGITHLDVIAVTHYDKDHVQGITSLLNTAGVTIYNSPILYDLGTPRDPTEDYTNYVQAITNRINAVALATTTPAALAAAPVQAAAAALAAAPITAAANAIAAAKAGAGSRAAKAAAALVQARIARRTVVSIPAATITAAAVAAGIAGGGALLRHATAFTNNFSIVQYNANDIATIPIPAFPLGVPALAAPLLPLPANFLDPYWLVGKEIMWGNGMDGLQGRPAFASAPPAGAPTITCVAANKYVQQGPPPGNVAYVHDPRIYDGPNRMSNNEIAVEELKEPNALSLAFLVQFNNFKYYVGGDLESEQEDGCINTRAIGGPIAQPGVMTSLNATDDIAGRVLAMKASHHGSDKSTSRQFIDRVRPAIAIISTGAFNQFQHPGEQCVNVLDGYARIPTNGDPNNDWRHPLQPPVPPYRPIPYYLTGYQQQDHTGTWTSFGGAEAEVAGDPRVVPPDLGHIRLEVTSVQSQLPVVGQAHRGITAAANQVITALGPAAAAAGLVAANVAAIAEKGATYGSSTAIAVAAALGLVVAPPNAILPHPIALRAMDAMAYMSTDAQDEGVIQEAIDAAVTNATATNAFAAATAGALLAGAAAAAAAGALLAGAAAAGAIGAGGGTPQQILRVRAAAIAAAMAGNGTRVAGIGVGGNAVAAVIGVIVAASAAAPFPVAAWLVAINTAFQTAAPVLTAPATALQAAQAATTVVDRAIAFAHPQVGVQGAAFGAVAAIAAVQAGASVVQAVAIATALVGTFCNLNANDMATLTVRAMLAVPGAGPTTPALAAFAGAVAGATWQNGVPAEVQAAVTAALTAAGFAAAAAPAGVNALAAANAIAPNTLFTLQYISMNPQPPAGGPHAPGNFVDNKQII